MFFIPKICVLSVVRSQQFFNFKWPSMPWKDGNAWFTTVPFKRYLISNVYDIVVFYRLIFSCSKSVQVNFVEKPKLKILSFQNYKHSTLIYTWLDKAFRVPLLIGYCQSHFCREGEGSLAVPSCVKLINIQLEYQDQT